MNNGIKRTLAGFALATALAAVLPPAAAGDNEDADAIAELKEAGVDLSEPQMIAFSFYLPSRQAAEKVASKLIGQGFKTRMVPAGGGKDYVLYARKRIVVTEPAMLEWRKRFEALAQSVQGEYDGWGSSSPR
jgi:hypothetical protein